MAKKREGPTVEKGKPYPMFEVACLSRHIEQPKREWVFHPSRQWRFDFAWVEERVSLEIEGGAFRGQGHRSVRQFLSDMEKYNEAQLLGWTVLRCTTDAIEDGSVFELLERALS